MNMCLIVLTTQKNNDNARKSGAEFFNIQFRLNNRLKIFHSIVIKCKRHCMPVTLTSLSSIPLFPIEYITLYSLLFSLSYKTIVFLFIPLIVYWNGKS